MTDRDAGTGAGVASGRTDTPVGPVTAVTTSEGLAALAFGHAEALGSTLARLSDPSGRAARCDAGDTALQALADTRRQLEEYFQGTRRDFDLPLDWSLAKGFAREVLGYATRVPYGSVTTYAALAEAAGKPRAARAVGNALGANPLAIVVPCHRVVRSDGGTGGYTSGPAKKTFLLRLEGSPVGAASR